MTPGLKSFKNLISLSQYGFNVFFEDLTWETIEISQSALKIQNPHTPDPRNEIISYHVSGLQGINRKRVSIKSPSQYGLNLNHSLQEDRQMTNDPSGSLTLQAGQDRGSVRWSKRTHIRKS